jgi:Domain of unknown function (DUF1929)
LRAAKAYVGCVNLPDGALVEANGGSAPGSTVKRVSLTSSSAPTHATDPNQRYVSLPLAGGRMTIPTNRALLPPGWYRIWAIDTVGRPSVAGWLRLA